MVRQKENPSPGWWSQGAGSPAEAEHPRDTGNPAGRGETRSAKLTKNARGLV